MNQIAYLYLMLLLRGLHLNHTITKLPICILYCAVQISDIYGIRINIKIYTLLLSKF